MNIPAAPRRDDYKPLAQVTSMGELFRHPEFAERINQAVPRHMSGERLLRTFALAVQKTPKLATVPPLSMMGAFITLATLGLEPNTPLHHAHLIPFDVNKWNPNTRSREFVRTDVQVIIGYEGYVELIYRSSKVVDLHCDVVFAGDEFSFEYGSSKHLKHVPKRDMRRSDEEPIYAYMHARLKDGGEVFNVMTRADVHLARSRSQGFRTAMVAHDKAVGEGKDPLKNPAYADAPWIKDAAAMWRKTALRGGQKWIPKSIELATAMTIDDTDRPVNFGAIHSADMVLDGSIDMQDEPDVAEPPSVIAPAKEPSPPAAQATAQETASRSRGRPRKATPVDDFVPETQAIERPYDAFGERVEGPPCATWDEWQKVHDGVRAGTPPELIEAFDEYNAEQKASVPDLAPPTELARWKIEMETCKTADELKAYIGNAAVKAQLGRFREAHPDLANELSAHYKSLTDRFNQEI